METESSLQASQIANVIYYSEQVSSSVYNRTSLKSV
jgi:hypothetical protein